MAASRPGLPSGIEACLFDMDGVLTRTATVHAKAWAEAFDGLLRRHAEAGGPTFVPFDPVVDYTAYVDGKSRDDGVRDFLASRAITLPEGRRDDPPEAETVRGVGNAKNVRLLEVLGRDGVEVFAGSVRFLHAARAAGLRTAVVSSSANTVAALTSAGLLDLMDARVDGTTIAAERIRGKPAPDSFLLAARRLGVTPAACAVFEDALAGVEAGRAGDFGWVVGVDRADQREGLLAHGADVVVDDLAELLA
ncbi:MAG TPA: beta-phosphoglucomutase family hydrolase [Thermoleophilaceae bacterium]|jgi:beta-phosphoglucomutase family hydrolase|nr:beta-phosphoglucomutase family hydrolase [Thermoleophilaceae bacterium]